MSESTFQQPRFFIGAVRGKNPNNPKATNLTVVDLEKWKFYFFPHPCALAEAVKKLCSNISFQVYTEDVDVEAILNLNNREGLISFDEDGNEIVGDDQSELSALIEEGLHYRYHSADVEVSEESVGGHGTHLGRFRIPKSGKLFDRRQFTYDLSDVPEGLLQDADLISLKQIAEEYQMINEAIEVAFHPEEAEAIKRSHGLTGMIDPGPQSDSLFG
jgi:hypothetical protein